MHAINNSENTLHKHLCDQGNKEYALFKQQWEALAAEHGGLPCPDPPTDSSSSESDEPIIMPDPKRRKTASGSRKPQVIQKPSTVI